MGNQNNEDREPLIVEWGMMLFGLGILIFFLFMLIEDGGSIFFSVFRNNRGGGFPGFLIFIVSLVMFIFPFKKIIKR